MSANEEVKNKSSVISELNVADNMLLLDEKMADLSVICSVMKSLYRSIEFDAYSKEKFSHYEIGNIVRKQNKELEEILYSVCDGIDQLGFEINSLEKESKEDKKRLARLTYAFINNGELDKARKELEKILAE